MATIIFTKKKSWLIISYSDTVPFLHVISGFNFCRSLLKICLCIEYYINSIWSHFFNHNHCLYYYFTRRNVVPCKVWIYYLRKFISTFLILILQFNCLYQCCSRNKHVQKYLWFISLYFNFRTKLLQLLLSKLNEVFYIIFISLVVKHYLF